MKTDEPLDFLDPAERERTITAAYLSLASAIIVQACNDYREFLRGQCEFPERTLSEVMRFFNSEWYEQMTTVDYHLLIENMDKEWKSGKKLLQAGLEVNCPKLKKRYTFKCPLCGGEAEAHVCRFTRSCRKDGSRKYTYIKTVSCSCHISEKATIKEEITRGKI